MNSIFTNLHQFVLSPAQAEEFKAGAVRHEFTDELSPLILIVWRRDDGRMFIEGTKPKPRNQRICSCLGTCRGAAGLGEGWVCALEHSSAGTPR